MAKCRIGHFVEAQILQAIEIDYIDESEVLSPADDMYHIDKTQFDVPFVCGARDLGEALRRIAEGATMIRTKGEPGTGDVVQAVRHMRTMNSRDPPTCQPCARTSCSRPPSSCRCPLSWCEYVHDNGQSARRELRRRRRGHPGRRCAHDAAGRRGRIRGLGHLQEPATPQSALPAIVKAVANYTDAKLIAELSEDLGEAMVGINESEIALLMAERGK